MTPEQMSDILEILDEALDMTVATVRDDDYPQATTVSFVHDGLNIYFGCDPNSQKVRNIRHSDKISLTVDLPYQKWNRIRGLSLGGRAHFVTEPAEMKRVFDMMFAKFPQIKEYVNEADGEEVSIVCIKPEVVSLIDYRKGFGYHEEIAVQ